MSDQPAPRNATRSEVRAALRSLGIDTSRAFETVIGQGFIRVWSYALDPVTGKPFLAGKEPAARVDTYPIVDDPDEPADQ